MKKSGTLTQAIYEYYFENRPAKKDNGLKKQFDSVVKIIEKLIEAGVAPEEVRAILAHGFGHCNDVEPLNVLEKSLFTVDELTGIIQACARMRPKGITDLEIKSFMKKFKDKKFAAKCDRALVLKGCEMLGMDVKDVAAICIDGMREHAEEIGLLGTEA